MTVVNLAHAYQLAAQQQEHIAKWLEDHTGQAIADQVRSLPLVPMVGLPHVLQPARIDESGILQGLKEWFEAEQHLQITRANDLAEAAARSEDIRDAHRKKQMALALIKDWLDGRKVITADDPLFDCTDGAHPAWWRGEGYGFDECCKLVHRILDGDDNGTGVMREPAQSLRQRLHTLMTDAKAYDTLYGERRAIKQDAILARQKASVEEARKRQDAELVGKLYRSISRNLPTPLPVEAIENGDMKQMRPQDVEE